jgi:hypothetical protein
VTIPFIGCASDAHRTGIGFKFGCVSDTHSMHDVVCTCRRGAIQTCMLYIMCIFKISIQTKQ